MATTRPRTARRQGPDVLFLALTHDGRLRDEALIHLRAFVTIVDTGGVGRAVTHLGLSQPALSRQIRALETELEVRLFDRMGRRVRLTSEGEGLLPRARDLLTDVDSLGERARSLKTGETGILRVAATPQVIENLLAEFLVQYRRRPPAWKSTSWRMVGCGCTGASNAATFTWP